mgnify:CR=1 FL=1
MFQTTKYSFFLNLSLYLKKNKSIKVKHYIYNSIKTFYLLKKKNSYLSGNPKNIFNFFLFITSYSNIKKINNLKR